MSLLQVSWSATVARGFPDVFEQSWAESVQAIAERECAPRRDNPNLLGYFLGPSVSLLTLTGWMPLLVALVRTTPDVVMVQSQRGWAKAAYCTPIWPPQASRCVRLFCRSRVAAP